MERARTWTARAGACALVAGAALAAAGCGGGERQDEDEPRGTFPVSVDAEFAERQALARGEELQIAVRNTGQEALPNVAVTVDGLSDRSKQPDLADPERPVWIVDQGPRGGVTAYTGTWALGRVEAGQTKTFRWRLTPVRAGTHKVSWKVAAGLDGKARAEDAGGREPSGAFTVQVADEPPASRVDPETGEVVRGSVDGE
ncbi:DUF11 domain-containing protein [Conexibacter sp. SYSU D00693]|uniref:DUF11 domain-containing protein n=1 Tax=Conexibacter sp. SYSU D00693 TaxID=2812560 RepID=UPI00196ABDB2|nr:DUF11 domain-containing protein [Conexibacter sp. SYSU D00693]